MIPGYFFLASYLFVMILQIIMKLAGKLWLMQNMRLMYQLSYYLPFLYGPLILFFVRQYTARISFLKRDGLHFFPFIFSFACILPGSSSWLPLFIWPIFAAKWIMILQLISLCFYHIAAFRFLKKNNAALSPAIISVHRERQNWMRQFIIGSVTVTSVVAILICFMYYSFPRLQGLRFGFTALTVFIYWVSYKAWIQPELFSVVFGEANRSDKIVSAIAIHPVKKYSNSGLKKEDLFKIIASLKNKFFTEKLYLDPELTIDTLAASLGYSKYHLSQAMNDELGQSFYDCINQYRVEEAKILLRSPEKNSYKIASLAFDAGFNSISTFNEVFKKFTGLTPSQFRKQREENNLRKQRV